MSGDDFDTQSTLVIGFPDYEVQAKCLAEHLGVPFQCVDIHRFPDGECKLQLSEVMPAHAILCRSLDHPDKKLFEIILAAAGARQLGAKSVSLVAPYLCYMRQDKAFNPGEVISQRVVGKLLADYFDKVVTVDAHLHRVHALQDVIPARSAINASATVAMADFIHDRVERPYLLGPDAESEQWVSEIAAAYQMDFGVASKRRYGDRHVEISLPMRIEQARHIVLVDDVASTGQTLIKAIALLAEFRPASVAVMVTHALFVDDAIEQLNAVGVTDIWSCDSIGHASNKIKLVDVLASAIVGEYAN